MTYQAGYMDEELQLDLEEGQQINKTQERIKSLATKVSEEARLKDEAVQKFEEANARAEAAERESKFYSEFTEILPKYQAAPEYRNDILEKVKAGYTVEDATVAVLNANGKLSPQAPQIESYQAAGGSAPTALPSTDGKQIGEMTQEERRMELSKPERAAELESILRNGL